MLTFIGYMCLSSIATSRRLGTNLRHSLDASRRGRRRNWHLTGISRLYTSTTSSFRMPFLKSKSKLAGRVIAILRLRPTVDKEEPSDLEPTNCSAGHDHSDLPSPSRPPPISMIGLTSTRTYDDDPIIAQSGTAPSLSDGISSSDDPVHQAHNHPRYENTCFH